jgi:hypothetical protein
MTIPTLFLSCYTGLEGKDFTPTTHHDIYVADQRITPKDAKIHIYLLNLITSLAKHYVFEQKKAICSFETTITFSTRNGVTFSLNTDLRLIDVFHQIKGTPVELPLVKETQTIYDNVKQVFHPKKYTAYPQAVPSTTMFYVDEVALGLVYHGVDTPTQIRVSVQAQQAIPAEAKLSASIRFPHLMHTVMERYSQTTPKICLIDARIAAGKCPLFVEFRALFKKSPITLFSESECTIKALSLIKTSGIAFYDISTLRARLISLTDEDSLTPTPVKYAPWLEQMRDGLIELAKDPSDKRMIQGTGPVKPLMLANEAEKMEIHLINASSPEFTDTDKKSFDIVVGIFSLSTTLGETLITTSNFDPVLFMQKYLELLKDEGTLYVDAMLYDDHYQDPLIWKTLEERLNTTFIIEEIPFTDFLPTAIGKQANIPLLTRENIRNLLKNDGSPRTVSTVYLTSIRREDAISST